MSDIPFHHDFETRVKQDAFLGENLLLSLNTTSPTSIRFNPFKTQPKMENLQSIPWCENAYFLSERPSFTLDPHFHAGAYYSQEAGSMILDLALRQLSLPETPIVLDLCAAPGGKSTLISSFLNKTGLLVSNEVIGSRSKILQENLTKWGDHHVVITNSDPKDFERVPSFFDLIVVDAPCSGEGMFRKTPKARQEWSTDNVNLCSARQKRIVHDVFPSLKEDGILLYSTCTFNEEENEKNVAYFQQELDLEPISLNLPFAKKDRLGLGYYCLPSEMESEGFYLVALQKRSSEKASKFSLSTDFVKSKNQQLHEEFLSSKEVGLYEWREKMFMLPSEFEKEMVFLQQKLRLVKIGTQLGEANRKGFSPSIEISLHSELRKDYPSFTLDKAEALKYLSCETFHIPAEKGNLMLRYEDSTIGMVKHLGNRFNSYWPKEWRIRMQH